MELAAGMLALALVASALCGFAVYIARSLRAQNELRKDGGDNSRSDSVEVGEFAAQYVFGRGTFPIREKVRMPGRTIMR